LVEDAIQTAAMRALSRTKPVTGGQEGIVRWTTTVAWHEVVAEWRRQSRVEATADLDPPGEGDPAPIVECRLMAEAVRAGFRSLSVGEQEVVLSRLDETRHGGPEPSRTKVRRYRARQHLAALIDWTDTEVS
jgi:DNA-directed RNA polymerase specialized sigma24 family protein